MSFPLNGIFPLPSFCLRFSLVYCMIPSPLVLLNKGFGFFFRPSPCAKTWVLLGNWAALFFTLFLLLLSSSSYFARSFPSFKFPRRPSGWIEASLRCFPFAHPSYFSSIHSPCLSFSFSSENIRLTFHTPQICTVVPFFFKNLVFFPSSSTKKFIDGTLLRLQRGFAGVQLSLPLPPFPGGCELIFSCVWTLFRGFISLVVFFGFTLFLLSAPSFLPVSGDFLLYLDSASSTPPRSRFLLAFVEPL